MLPSLAHRFVTIATALTFALAFAGCSDSSDQDAPNDPDAGVESDADVDSDGGETDGGEHHCADGDTTDTDDDGLFDCEEEEMCTDAENPDTDGDGVNDMEEVFWESDPCDPDTDGDGLGDSEELKLGLDPTSEYSYDNDIHDSEHWFLDACNEEEPRDVGIYTDGDEAFWKLGLASDFDEYENLTLPDDADDGQAAAAFSSDAHSVAGAIFAQPRVADQTPHELLDEYQATLETHGAIEYAGVGAPFETHEYHRAATGRFSVSNLTPRVLSSELRDDLLADFAPFAADAAGDLPEAGADRHADFHLYVTVLVREDDQGDDELVTIFALAPQERYDDELRVQNHLDDVTNTTQLAEPGAEVATRCDHFERMGYSRFDFYLVIDQTLDEHSDEARQLAEGLVDELSHTRVDYRFGVTTMDPANEGALDADFGWHDDRETLLDAVDAALDAEGNEVDGLEAARDGIEAMADEDHAQALRPIADTVTIFVTDQEAQTFVDTPPDSDEGQALLDDYIDFFSERTIAFGFLGDGDECGRQEGVAYQEVIEGIGRTYGSLCEHGPEQVIGDILFASSAVSALQFPVTPMPTTIRVLDGDGELERSQTDGFDYFAWNNSFALSGPAREWVEHYEAHLVVLYDYFVAELD